MIHLMCGCNFDPKLLDGYIELNKNSDLVKIKEIFGSFKNDPIGCSREKDRLPEIDNNIFEKFVKKVNDNKIEFNYTLNKSCIGSVEDFYLKDYNSFIKFIKYLQDVGVNRVTVTHPLLMEIISEEVKILIEVSTIIHTYSTRQIQYYKKYNIDKICMNLMKNRDIQFLKNYASICKENNIILELMVNEACLFSCPYRLCHYNQQSHTDVNKKLFSNYPIGRCSKIHYTEKIEWVMARLIRPEDIKRYVNIGIRHFKVTGRTHITDTQLRIVKYYMDMKLDGNLLDLFPQFYNIYKGTEEQINAPFFIDNNKMKYFLNYWFDNPHFRCDEHCDYDCKYCYDFLKQIES